MRGETTPNNVTELQRQLKTWGVRTVTTRWQCSNSAHDRLRCSESQADTTPVTIRVNQSFLQYSQAQCTSLHPPPESISDSASAIFGRRQLPTTRKVLARVPCPSCTDLGLCIGITSPPLIAQYAHTMMCRGALGGARILRAAVRQTMLPRPSASATTGGPRLVHRTTDAHIPAREATASGLRRRIPLYRLGTFIKLIRVYRLEGHCKLSLEI